MKANAILGIAAASLFFLPAGTVHAEDDSEHHVGFHIGHGGHEADNHGAHHRLRRHRLHRRFRHHRLGRPSHGLHLDGDGFQLRVHSGGHRSIHHRRWRHLRHRSDLRAHELHERLRHLERSRHARHREAEIRHENERRHRIGASARRRRHRDAPSHEGNTHRDRGDAAREHRAWSHLANGRAHEALKAFSELAPASPRTAAPKVGYALAMADLGRHHKAAWAMRRAVRIDPSGVRYLDAPKGVHARLEELAKAYRHRGARHGRADDWFMAAALYYLADEGERALEALDHLRHEHVRASTSNLDELIAERHS